MKVWFALTGLTMVLVAAPSTAAAMKGPTPQCFGQAATIVGTPATETIHGTAGPDVIVGGGSDVGEFGDEIFGLGGDDLICTELDGSMESIVHAGSGDDQVRSVGNLFGGPGNDSLIDPVARGDIVNLFGGPGDDVMRSRATDIGAFVPGPGDDSMVAAPGGWNIVTFRGASAGMVVDLRNGTARGEGNDTFDRINVVVGSEFADVMFGNDRWSLLFGLAGDDMLVGGAGRDGIAGGDGDDRVDGGPGNDDIEGQAGRDMLFGRSGNDQLVERKRPEPNLILGGSGKDNCAGGYRIPPNIERGCETHNRPESGGGGKLLTHLQRTAT